MDDAPRCWMHRDMTDEQFLAIGELKARTWPKPGVGADVRAEATRRVLRRDPGRPELASRSFVLLDGDEVIAHASLEPRRLGTDSGPLWIMGLGGVCSSPARRGEGLGARIVRAAFKVIDDGLAPFSLFQTSQGVRPFYERLGCVVCPSRFVDSTADDPKEPPFWDEVVMRYPDGDGWPEGTIDLAGPGY